MKNNFKCLVNNNKEVNVFILESLNFLGEKNYLDDIDVILNCTKEFYNNSFPIIGIINDNEEGDIKLALYLEQLLQIKLVQRTYFAAKKRDLVKNEINKNIQERKDILFGLPLYPTIIAPPLSCKSLIKKLDAPEEIPSVNIIISEGLFILFNLYNSSLIFLCRFNIVLLNIWKTFVLFNVILFP